MFRSRLLDRFTRVHVAVVPAIFVPIIVVFAVLALQETSAGRVALGVLSGYVLRT